MKYKIITYGCQMNESDSERIATILDVNGFEKTESLEHAGMVIFNACSVRQMAFDRVWGKALDIQRNNPGVKLILTGCVTQADMEKFGYRFDFVFKIADLDKFGKFLRRTVNYSNYLEIYPEPASKFSVYIPISTGCNNFCSYCVVPHTRGQEFYRPAKDIMEEVKNFLAKGYKEIILLGQNVNSYHSGKTDFATLIQRINNLPHDFWLTFLTSHPKDMPDKLIDTLAKSQKVTPYIHLPIQSGNDQILRAMNRKYTSKHYLNLVAKIRNAFKKYRPSFPPVAISTDIIVGFPGETKEQFLDTAKIMQKAKFDMAYLAEFSPRPGTPAFYLKDNVPKKEKSRRKNFLNRILTKTALEHNKKYIGKAIDILIEEAKKDFSVGKTITGKKILVQRKDLKPGDAIKSKISAAKAWNLKGK